MKNLQRKTDKFVITARELSSRGMSFIILMLGVALQASHTTLLMYNIAAFDQWWLKLIVALGIGVFISSALAIFTLKYDGVDQNIKQLINVFFYFEIFTNVFYYWDSLIFSVGFEGAVLQDWLYLIIAMPFSFIMPFSIKKFAGVINSDEKLALGDIDAPDELIVNPTMTEALNESLATFKEEVLTEAKLAAEQMPLPFNPDDYLKKGQNVELIQGDKKFQIKLG